MRSRRSRASPGSTWTTTSARGSARAHRRLDRVGQRVALADRGVRAHADHDVDEVGAGRLAHAQALDLDARLVARDRVARRRGRRLRGAVHQHVDVAAREPGGGDDHEHGDDERRDRVALRVAALARTAAR